MTQPWFYRLGSAAASTAANYTKAAASTLSHVEQNVVGAARAHLPARVPTLSQAAAAVTHAGQSAIASARSFGGTVGARYHALPGVAKAGLGIAALAVPVAGEEVVGAEIAAEVAAEGAVASEEAVTAGEATAAVRAATVARQAESVSLSSRFARTAESIAKPLAIAAPIGVAGYFGAQIVNGYYQGQQGVVAAHIAEDQARTSDALQLASAGFTPQQIAGDNPLLGSPDSGSSSIGDSISKAAKSIVPVLIVGGVVVGAIILLNHKK